MTSKAQTRNFNTLIICGIGSWIVYLGILLISRQFAWDTEFTTRPLLPLLGMFASVVVLYLIACRTIFRSASDSRNLTAIIAMSVAFRVVMLFSEPIQEIDAYRYIWDGKVVAAGVNPFRFSPHEVLQADKSAIESSDFERLISIRDASAANREILSRVHFGELTTVYPPVSQIVFGAVAAMTPHAAPVATQMLLMKMAIVLFDLGTLAIVVGLLRFVGKPAEWSLLYGWCPLVIKEFANSGHLDSIAVFLSAAAVLCALKAFFSGAGQAAGGRWLWMCALLVVGAVGAKIYPVVIFPLLFFGAWRTFSFVWAFAVAGTTLALVVLMILPMLSREQTMFGDQSVDSSMLADSPEWDTTEPPRPPGSDVEQSVPALTVDSQSTSQTGLAAFTAHWQINDFLFLLLYENLRPVADEPSTATSVEFAASESEFGLPPRPSVTNDDTSTLTIPEIASAHPLAWFVLTSSDWRNRLSENIASSWNVNRESVPFFATRIVTSLIFLTVAMGIAIRSTTHVDAEHWLSAVFLTVAWFWLLQPTQNPWYWAWAMPFLPFARSRAWFAVSGLALIYYFRFWLSYHFPATPVAGTPYHGEAFFDLCVVWLEFAPFLAVLAWTYFYPPNRGSVSAEVGHR